MKDWSNIAKVVYKRTYARKDTGIPESWEDTVYRVIKGNVRNHEVSEKEINRLEHFLLNRKAMPAGRGLWFSGAPSHERLGGAALNNCWYLNGDEWENLVLAQDLLMLGGGVGMSVEHRFVSQLPRVKKFVRVVHNDAKDADFIIPDSREGWCELTRKVLEAFFVTGKSFSFSTVCLRPKGSMIKGFGGTASGGEPVIKFVEDLSRILNSRAGLKIRPIDMADLLCAVADMVIAGNVRRSALMIMGDWHDKLFLRAKRWDLGPIPGFRARGNFSIVASEPDELTPLFWKTYEVGEPFGIINRDNMQKYARMGELKEDDAVGVNPCAEATLTNGEPCNLQELVLPHFDNEEELVEAGRLMHRWGKRVTCEKFHNPKNEAAVKKYRRIGTGITGCLQAPQYFNKEVLNKVYLAIQDENRSYSKELGIAESIRTTVVKPSGTVSKIADVSEGIHAFYSKFMFQTIRFAANDPLIPDLRAAGHHMEPEIKLDGTLNHDTLVVYFPLKSPENCPVADENWDLFKQLEVVKLAQKYWADQSVSVTVYYKKEEIPKLKEWLNTNLSEIKTISFLCHSDHGFLQAPKQAITEEEYDKAIAKIKSLSVDSIGVDGDISSQECEGGVCPMK